MNRHNVNNFSQPIIDHCVILIVRHFELICVQHEIQIKSHHPIAPSHSTPYPHISIFNYYLHLSLFSSHHHFDEM